jgi:alpha-N-acetylglucosamine transferase
MERFDMSGYRKIYTFPDSFKREDGSSKYAFVTFLMINDSYLPGALLFAYSLLGKRTQADLVCMVTDRISSGARYALSILFDHVVEIGEIYIPNKRGHERQDIPFMFTRFQALRLGEDGDLGFKYEKIVAADADVLPIRFFDHLFTLDTPAGIINESRDNFLEHDTAGRYVMPPSVYSEGKWNWHHIYDPVCPHGSRIPEEITDRVRSDPENMGINSSLFVIKPSYIEYMRIMNDLTQPEIYDLITERFKWPEMQYITMAWSGTWTSIDLRFSGISGYPYPDVLCGIHYAGAKPWRFKDNESIKKHMKFPDHVLWYNKYMEMVGEKYPQLQKIQRLGKLLEKIRS